MNAYYDIQEGAESGSVPSLRLWRFHVPCNRISIMHMLMLVPNLIERKKCIRTEVCGEGAESGFVPRLCLW
jgi:hypothetical protein